MGLLLVVAAAIGWWAWRTREQASLRFGDVAAVVAALIALHLLTSGKPAIGLLTMGGVGWWYWFRRHEGADAASAPASHPAPHPAPMSAERARRLLDVPAGADASEIRAAHRRLVARLHPDAGGSDALAAEVNAARDALLARAGRRR